MTSKIHFASQLLLIFGHAREQRERARATLDSLAPSDQTVNNLMAPPERVRSRRNNRLFLFGLVLITLARLYLVRNEDILSYYFVYDDVLYAQLGEQLFWGRPPDEKSLVRLPAYPLWIWGVHRIGVPLYVGTTLLAVAGSMFLAFSLRKLHVSRIACTVIYAAQLFEMNSIVSMRWISPSNLYGILFTFALGWMARALASIGPRQLLIGSFGAAVSLGLLSITRAEGALAWMAFAFFGVAIGVREVLTRRSWSEAWRNIVGAGLLPMVALIAMPLAVAAANKKVFGVFTACSLTSSGFSAAINSLLSVRPDKDIPHVPVTQDARRKAYAVSPALAKLAPALEGPRGRAWGRPAAQLYKVAPEEVGGGWFLFALREAVALQSKAPSPKQEDVYFRRITRELRQGFKEGRLPKRRVWLSFVQPDPTIIDRIPLSLRRILGKALSPPPPADIDLVARRLRAANYIWEFEELCDRVTYRRSRYLPNPISVSGWGFSRGHPLISVLAWRGDGTPLPVVFQSYQGIDVFKATRGQFPELPADCPVRFKATIFLGEQQLGGVKMKAIFGDGTELPIQMDQMRAQKIPSGSGIDPVGFLRIESVKRPPQTSSADTYRASVQMALIGKIYARVFNILVIALVPCVLVLILMRRSPQNDSALYLWLIPLGGFIAARVALLTIIDASSFDGTLSRYLITVPGPLAAGLIALFDRAIIVMRSYVFRPAKRQTAL